MSVVRWLGEALAGVAGRLRRRSGDAAPAPAGWNKTVAELWRINPAPSTQELAWARDYERSQLAPSARFPQWGDVYEPRQELDVPYLTRWRAPFTGGGTARLGPGDQVVVSDVQWESEPLSVYVEAVAYEALEARVIPKDERQAPAYAGFYFHLYTADLNREWCLVRERPQWPRRPRRDAQAVPDEKRATGPTDGVA